MTVACDVSEFQTTANDVYPHRWLIFRACDGSYIDHNVRTNLAWALHARATGRLDGFTVYVVYRPGRNDSILSILDGLGVPRDCHVMIDAETWSGAITGNHSAALNDLAGRLASRQGSGDRVWGYANRGDFASMWPSRPSWLAVVVASYGGQRPTGIANMVGWQYTNGVWQVPGLPSSTPPFGACDHNVLTDIQGVDMSAAEVSEIKAAIAAIPAAVWAKTFGTVGADGKPTSSPHSAAVWLADVSMGIRNVPTNAELNKAIADAFAAHIGGDPQVIAQAVAKALGPDLAKQVATELGAIITKGATA